MIGCRDLTSPNSIDIWPNSALYASYRGSKLDYLRELIVKVAEDILAFLINSIVLER
jgi:hypothetical protein